jgi:hypothetical protein
MAARLNGSSATPVAVGNERVGDPALDQPEAGQQGGGQGERPERGCAGEPGLLGPGEAADEQQQAGGAGDRARHLEPPRGGLVAVLGEQQGCQRQPQRAHGDVDPEHPVPTQRAGQHAAQEEPGDAAARRRGRPDAQGAGTLGAVGEGGGEQRQGRRDGDRFPQPLEGAGPHQQRRDAGQAAGQRGNGEQGEPSGEQPPAAVQVGGPAGQQQHAPKAQRVDARHPLQVLFGQAGIAPDGGQGDDHDGDAEHIDELATHSRASADLSITSKRGEKASLSGGHASLQQDPAALARVPNQPGRDHEVRDQQRRHQHREDIPPRPKPISAQLDPIALDKGVYEIPHTLQGEEPHHGEREPLPGP